MGVRRASINDIGEIVDSLNDYYEENTEFHGVKFVRQDMVKVVETYIRSPAYFAAVGVNKNDDIIGMLFGSLCPYMFNRRRFWASDLFFISRGAGPALLRMFKEWAKAKGADRVVIGVSSGDPRADKVLELTGFENTGGMYKCLL